MNRIDTLDFIRGHLEPVAEPFRLPRLALVLAHVVAMTGKAGEAALREAFEQMIKVEMIE